MSVDENKRRIEILKRMLRVGKFLANDEMSEVYELGHYIADNILSKVCMLIGIEKKREDLVYKDNNKEKTRDFRQLYQGILEHFYPDVPKYDDFTKAYHRDRNKYQHSIESLELTTIKKPLAIEYLKFVEVVMKKVGYLGKSEMITPLQLISSYSHRIEDYQKKSLEENFKKFYDRLASSDLEHIHIDIKTILEKIGDRNLQEILKMEPQRTRLYEFLLIEHDAWFLHVNDGTYKMLSINKLNKGAYEFSEPDKNQEILQEFLKMVKDRCKDAGLDIS